MRKQYVQALNGEFFVDEKPIRLRGFGIGSWMNFEHFMLRIPGSERRIREVFAEVYGQDNAEIFFDDFLSFFIGNDDFIFLKSLGVNSIRLAINYRHLEDDQAPGQYIVEGFKHIDRVVELCRQHGIYAIIDMHTSPGGQNPDTHSGSATGTAGFWNDASFRNRIVSLWKHVANRYKDEPIIAGYDVLNEPAFVSNRNAFNEFYDQAIQAIRSVDSDHIIFLEGDYWARDFSIFNRLGGHQQAISFHFYPGQHVSIYNTAEERKQEIDKRLKYFTDLRDQTNMPLWVGETGGLFPINRRELGNELVEQCLDSFEENGISWSFWAYKDAQSMSLVYPKKGTAWMSFANSLRSNWQSKKTRTDNVVDEVFELIEQKLSYEIDLSEKEKHSFRISSLLYDLHVDYLVKPKLESIAWEEIKDLPKSFLWENCDYWNDIADFIKTYSEQPPRYDPTT